MILPQQVSTTAEQQTVYQKKNGCKKKPNTAYASNLFPDRPERRERREIGREEIGQREEQRTCSSKTA